LPTGFADEGLAVDGLDTTFGAGFKKLLLPVVFNGVAACLFSSSFFYANVDFDDIAPGLLTTDLETKEPLDEDGLIVEAASLVTPNLAGVGFPGVALTPFGLIELSFPGYPDKEV